MHLVKITSSTKPIIYISVSKTLFNVFASFKHKLLNLLKQIVCFVYCWTMHKWHITISSKNVPKLDLTILRTTILTVNCGRWVFFFLCEDHTYSFKKNCHYMLGCMSKLANSPTIPQSILISLCSSVYSWVEKKQNSFAWFYVFDQ